MKISCIILFSLIGLSFHPLKSQSNHKNKYTVPPPTRINERSIIDSFLDSTYTWIEAENNGGYTVSWRYTIESYSSLINGKEYYQVLRADKEFSKNWSGTGHYIRYENNIVYTPWLDTEAEVINFNLEVGDTFSVIPPQFGVELVVDKIDTVTLLDGEPRRRWQLRCSWDDEPPLVFGYTEWIEGIGNIDGLFATDNMCVFDAPSNYILCLYKDNTILYDSPEYNTCWDETASLNTFEKLHLKLVPNPAYDRLTILDLDEPFRSIAIYDLSGKLRFEGKSASIAIDNFSPGIYMLVIFFENGTTAVQTFVKD